MTAVHYGTLTTNTAVPVECIDANRGYPASRLRSLRSDEDIAGAKLSLLARLHRAGRPMIAADIARAERLKPQSLTRIIAELDALGFIRREHDSFDHRQVLIEISPRGRRHLALHAIRQNAWLAVYGSTMLFAVGPEKPSSRAAIVRSSFSVAPATAPEPSGQ